jgi:hypothetical protein
MYATALSSLVQCVVLVEDWYGGASKRNGVEVRALGFGG